MNSYREWESPCSCKQEPGGSGATVTNMSPFALDLPHFSTESPTSLGNHDGWSPYLEHKPWLVLVGSEEGMCRLGMVRGTSDLSVVYNLPAPLYSAVQSYPWVKPGARALLPFKGMFIKDGPLMIKPQQMGWGMFWG